MLSQIRSCAKSYKDFLPHLAVGAVGGGAAVAGRMEAGQGGGRVGGWGSWWGESSFFHWPTEPTCSISDLIPTYSTPAIQPLEGP